MNTKNIALNVKRMAKVTGIKIGEIEDSVGVSRGFFSRVASGGIKDVPVSILINLADIFNTELQTLVDDPPVKTNADKFFEVFGIGPFSSQVYRVGEGAIVYTDWWNEPYKEKKG